MTNKQDSMEEEIMKKFDLMRRLRKKIISEVKEIIEGYGDLEDYPAEKFRQSLLKQLKENEQER